MRESKRILGIKHPSEFSLEERRMIIEEYLSSGKQKKEIWQKYTGRSLEKGNLLGWMRQLGYETIPKWPRLATLKKQDMAKKKQDYSLEHLQAQQRIAELEKALVQSELRATALETMIEIAEKELKISIKKKSYTKQSTR